MLQLLSKKSSRVVALTRPTFFSTISSTNALFNPTESHVALRSMVASFVAEKVEPQALDSNKHEVFNHALFKEAGSLGLLGVTVPEQYGGSGMDATAAVIIHEELSTSDPAFCLSYLAHSMLFANNLAQNGTPEQCERFLPKACSGEHICGMGMSEPGAGTDVLAMKTTAVESTDGATWTLNGAKMWITNGAINDTELGDCFLIYARTGHSGRATQDFSSFLVPKGTPGFSLGQRIKDKLGMRASMTAELVFDNVVLPSNCLVGGIPGTAVLSMMRNLEIERVVLAAMSIGLAKRCVDVMVSYASERQAFGASLSSFGQVQANIANSYAEVAAGRAYLYQTANALGLASTGNRIDTDGVKLFCAPMAKNVADRAIQTLGGYGYVAEYHVERLWRDAKLLEIGGGTNESHHKNMTRDLTALL